MNHTAHTPSHLMHMGMQVEGVRARGVQGRLLVTRNIANGRRWIVDPATGIGEPAPDEPPALPEVAGLASSAPKPARRSSGGPFVCEQCGEKHLFVLRFPDGTVMSKCLACRKFVVDGHVERSPARPRRASGGRGWRNVKGRPARKVSLPAPVLPLDGNSPEPA
jgi:hypothetical protein